MISNLKHLVGLRHGNYDKDGLTPEGIKQIERHIPYLKNITAGYPTLLLSSDYKRTKQTSEILSKSLNLKNVVLNELLRLNDRDKKDDLLDKYVALVNEQLEDYSSIILVGHSPIGQLPLHYAESQGLIIKPKINLIYDTLDFDDKGAGSHFDLEKQMVFSLPQ